MSYTIVARPRSRDFMKRQQGDFLLLQTGGKIIIRNLWQRVPKPAIP